MDNRRKWLWASVTIAFVLAAWSASAEGGFRRYLSLSQQVDTLRARNRQTADENNKLLKEVMGLSLADRQVLIEEVLESIDDDTFKAELKRRRDEYLADKSCSVPWTAIYDGGSGQLTGRNSHKTQHNH